MMVDQFCGLLARQRPVVLDGALGTMLIAQGLPAGHEPVRWNLEQPVRVLAVLAAYVESGSDIVHANTFGGNRARLAASGLDHLIEPVNAEGIRIAKLAAGSGCLAAGDIGPTGLMLPPAGAADPGELAAMFREQSAILAAAGADLLSIETMYDLREALLAVRAGRETGLPVMVSMTFEAKRRGFFTMMGDPLLPSLMALADSGACAAGLNCSVTSDIMLQMINLAAPAVPVPLAVQPNAGQPRPTGHGIAYDADAAAFAADIQRMAAAGAQLVGGCCGTTPEFISAIRALFPRTRTSP